MEWLICFVGGPESHRSAKVAAEPKPLLILATVFTKVCGVGPTCPPVSLECSEMECGGAGGVEGAMPGVESNPLGQQSFTWPGWSFGWVQHWLVLSSIGHICDFFFLLFDVIYKLPEALW